MKQYINIYTDGACSGNQTSTNLGGWGAVLEYGENKKEIFDGEKNTTNNRMELKAVLNAFRALKKEGLKVRIFSDSAYIVNCINKKWYVKWQKNNWMTSNKTPVENKDLWEGLISFLSIHEVEFYKVKGHVDIDKNPAALDKLYQRFLELNGNSFSFDDFKYITEMNNRADELANEGIKAASSRPNP